jgi:hypothetical protein
MALAITLLTVVQSVARFGGPFLFITFKSSDTGTNCDFTDPNKYETKGCSISNYYSMSAVYIGASTAMMLGACAMIYIKSKK